MKIDALIVLYNCSLSSSTTIRSILKSKLDNIQLNIIVWNNGPFLLEESDIQNYLNECQDKGIKSSLYQDIRNLSLSKIYNKFIRENDFDFFVIFDQDSEINLSFFRNISENSQYALICPAIYARQQADKQCFPANFMDIEQVTPLGEFILGETRTINSGTAISQKLINILLTEYNYVFDEKFAFYHTDHRLFDLINATSSAAVMKGLCIGEIYHDMTCELSQDEMSERAKLEIAYAKMLMRMYRSKNPKPQIIRNLFYAYKMKKKDKLNFQSFLKLLKCVITREHPRSLKSIAKNIEPTDSNTIKII